VANIPLAAMTAAKGFLQMWAELKSLGAGSGSTLGFGRKNRKAPKVARMGLKVRNERWFSCNFIWSNWLNL